MVKRGKIGYRMQTLSDNLAIVEDSAERFFQGLSHTSVPYMTSANDTVIGEDAVGSIPSSPGPQGRFSFQH